jgi:hypothetical protein
MEVDALMRAQRAGLPLKPTIQGLVRPSKAVASAQQGADPAWALFLRVRSSRYCNFIGRDQQTLPEFAEEGRGSYGQGEGTA